MKAMWREVNPLGKPRRFKKPDDLWQAAVKYFKWVEDNPIEKDIVGWHMGECSHDSTKHPRVMTLQSFHTHAGIGESLWRSYKTRDGIDDDDNYDIDEDYLRICNMIQGLIYDYKLSGAATGLFNHAIIAAEMGLNKTQPEEPREPVSLDINFNVKDCTVDKPDA